MRIGIALCALLALNTMAIAQEETPAVATPEVASFAPLTREEILARVSALSRAELGPVTPLPPFAGDPGQVVVRMSNPFDREITISARLTSGAAVWSMSPALIERTIPPMTSLEVSPEITPPEDDSMIAEPVMELTVSVPSGTGEMVEATVARSMAWITQVPLLAQTRAEREVDGYRRLLEGWEAAREFEPRSWDPSVPNPTDPPTVIKYGWAGQDELHLFLRFEDTELVDDPDNTDESPHSDALILRGINAQGERRDLAVFPRREGERRYLQAIPGSPESEWPVSDEIEAVARHHNAFENIQLWEIGLPLTALFGPDLTSHDGVMINIELHDSDGEGETTVRSWAPRWGPEWWVRMTFGPGADF